MVLQNVEDANYFEDKPCTVPLPLILSKNLINFEFLLHFNPIWAYLQNKNITDQENLFIHSNGRALVDGNYNFWTFIFCFAFWFFLILGGQQIYPNNFKPRSLMIQNANILIDTVVSNAHLTPQFGNSSKS